MYYCSMNVSDAEGLEVYGRNFRTLFLSTLFASKLWEGWKLLEKSYIQSNLNSQYDHLYTQEAKQALANLKSYFENYGDTLLNKIRNSTFHYPSDPKDKRNFESYYSETDENDGMEYFIGDAFENSLFGIDQFIANVVHITSASTVRDAISAINVELQKIASLFVAFMGEHILLFQKNCSFDQDDRSLENVVCRTEIGIPFFTKEPTSRTSDLGSTQGA